MYGKCMNFMSMALNSLYVFYITGTNSVLSYTLTFCMCVVIGYLFDIFSE